MKRKIAVVIILIVIAVSGIATATFFFAPNNDGWKEWLIPGNTNSTEPKYNYLSGGTLIPGEYRDPVYNEITGDWRPKYQNMTSDDYRWIFGNLQEFPQDFYSIVQLVYDGRILDYSRVAEAYWQQPEFYVGWYGSINDSYLNNDPNMWTPEGYGMFPLIKEVKLKAGGNYEIDAYLRTGFGVEAYQGIVLHPHLPESAKAITGDLLFNQPEGADQYIHTKILNEDDQLYLGFKDKIAYTNVGEEDWFVILKPTYQLVVDKYGNETEEGFPADWAQMVKLEIEIDAECPLGTYVVAIDSGTPCFEINQEYYYSQEHEYYGSMYYPAGRFHKSNKPHFQVVIEVI